MIDYATVDPEEAAQVGMAIAVYAAQKPDEAAVIDRFGEIGWGKLNARAPQFSDFAYRGENNLRSING